MATTLQQQVPTVSAPDAGTVNYLAEGFSALADPTRLSMIHLLMTKGEMCVCEFMPLLGITQSNVSFHLKALKYAGFITSRKEGRWMLYRLDRNAFGRFRAEYESVFDLGKWPEDDDPASRNEVTRSRLTCQQEQNQLLQGGNDNANE